MDIENQSIKNMRAAITMRIVKANGYDEPRDAISHDWLKLLIDMEMVPVVVPNILSDTAGYLEAESVDILILTGGDNIGVTPLRDVTESALLASAINRRIPIFGVCRGLQVINHYFGGSLKPIKGHIACSHKVVFVDGWKELYGHSCNVNSYHEIGVGLEGLSRELVPASFDETGQIEALYHQDKPIAAVMWHPERVGGVEGDKNLMRRLLYEGAFWK